LVQYAAGVGRANLTGGVLTDGGGITVYNAAIGNKHFAANHQTAGTVSATFFVSPVLVAAEFNMELARSLAARVPTPAIFSSAIAHAWNVQP